MDKSKTSLSFSQLNALYKSPKIIASGFTSSIINSLKSSCKSLLVNKNIFEILFFLRKILAAIGGVKISVSTIDNLNFNNFFKIC